MQNTVFGEKNTNCEQLANKEKISSFASLHDTLNDWWFFDNYVKERLKAQGVTT